jgi:hypothetical protein
MDDVAIDDVVSVNDDKVEHTIDDVFIDLDVMVDPSMEENTIFDVLILDPTRRDDWMTAVDVDNVEPYIVENSI